VSYSNLSTHNNDGGGFDFDEASVNCILEYSIAYNNYGYGVLFDDFSGTWTGNTVRYCILWGNNKNNPNILGEIYYYDISGSSTTSIYGNTIIGGINGEPCINSTNGTATVENNIFYVSGSGNIVTSAGTTTWSNNCYYKTSGTISHPTDSGAITSNPLLVTPTTIPTMTDPNNNTGAGGMKLQTGSPCIGAGTSISGGDGGVDFFGNVTAAPYSIGANYYTSTPPPTSTTYAAGMVPITAS
jgi:hypothetical protein